MKRTLRYTCRVSLRSQAGGAITPVGASLHALTGRAAALVLRLPTYHTHALPRQPRAGAVHSCHFGQSN